MFKTNFNFLKTAQIIGTMRNTEYFLMQLYLIYVCCNSIMNKTMSNCSACFYDLFNNSCCKTSVRKDTNKY